MSTFLIFLSLIALLVRIFFYDKSEGESAANISFTLFRRYFSIKYLFPLKREKDDHANVVRYKEISNWALYAFFIIFTLSVLIAIIQGEANR
jgi:hypothetical protein